MPSERKCHWGKEVTLVAGDVKLRISLDRGEHGVELSPNAERSEWTEVRDLLSVAIPEYVRPPYDPISLPEWAKLLEPHFPLIGQAYRPEHYPEMRRRLERLKADEIAETKDEVAAALAERARQMTLIRHVLSEFDSRFESAQAEQINALFEAFSDYRWNKERENRLRAGLNEVLLSKVGRRKTIEVMNRLMKMRETARLS